MRIEHLRLWQWLLVGLAFGGLLSLVLTFRGPWYDSAEMETMDPPTKLEWLAIYDHLPPGPRSDSLENERQLVEIYWSDKTEPRPMVRDVVVHPPGATGTATDWWVTGKYLTVRVAPKDDKSPKEGQVQAVWTPFRAKTSASPFLPAYHNELSALVRTELDGLLRDQADLKSKGQRLPKDKLDDLNRRQRELNFDRQIQDDLKGDDSFPDVTKFLDFAAKADPGRAVSYSVASYESGWRRWTYPPLAGLLIIGLGGPLTLEILRSYGWAAMPTPRAKQAKPARQKPAAAPPRPVMPATSTAGVRVVPAVPVKPTTPPEHKEYGGEYYPVVKTTHKDEE